jgi:hypothetical protein
MPTSTKPVTQSVAIDGVQAVGGGLSRSTIGGHENVQAHQQRLWAQQADAQATASGASGMLQKRVAEVDQSEANAIASLERSTLPSKVIATSSAQAVSQVLSKIAGNTPPVTP